MYIIGELITYNTFKLIYAVFEDEATVKPHSKKNENTLDVIKIDASFPFFIIEEFSNDGNYYKYVTKQELKHRIQKVKKEESTFVYFNLWRIDKDGYNKKFPEEPILNGMDFHIHFTDTDIKEIKINGFDAYWQDIITA